MTDLEQDHEKELIIIRRRPDMTIEKPHSGVWKIAHADFMTAMMAFFMVMWLISSTDEAAKKHIARYFNPVNLSSMTPFPKGLEDPETNAKPVGEEASPTKQDKASTASGASTAAGRSGQATPNVASAAAAQQAVLVQNSGVARSGTTTRQLPTFTEAEIFSDPYGVLDRIIMKEEKDSGPVERDDASTILAEKIQGQGGTAMRDPFAPLSWALNPLSLDDIELTEDASSANFSITGEERPDASSLANGSSNDKMENGKMEIAKATFETVRPVSALFGNDVEKGQKADQKATGKDASEPSELVEGQATASAMKAPHNSTTEGSKEDFSVKDAASGSAEAKAGQSAELSDKIDEFRTFLANALNETPRQTIGNELTVTTSGDDILINVSDSADYGMFAIGSSEPTARSIKLLERIAHSLGQIKGDIIIRGHTDSRPFRSGTSDNWNLSTARAHMARFMLIRGGLDEHRLLRVEGYADRALKHPDNPEADDNRRIEILVQPIKETRS
ncbi:MotB family protein [Cohaesibacter haloalkalitolerans]|uniref:MotB family protein n=1 Tax=Cohaesibacter haloalkalitolerans TaxID=1162980 RepID=UPI000E64D529|nr:MotB family protein [Cohaesibacter haloalkalitolerans]